MVWVKQGVVMEAVKRVAAGLAEAKPGKAVKKGVEARGGTRGATVGQRATAG